MPLQLQGRVLGRLSRPTIYGPGFPMLYPARVVLGRFTILLLSVVPFLPLRVFWAASPSNPENLIHRQKRPQQHQGTANNEINPWTKTAQDTQIFLPTRGIQDSNCRWGAEGGTDDGSESYRICL